MAMQKITPFLWFDTQAEEAAKYYVSIFPNSKINIVTHYSAAGPMPAGTVLTVAFELDGQKLTLRFYHIQHLEQLNNLPRRLQSHWDYLPL